MRRGVNPAVEMEIILKVYEALWLGAISSQQTGGGIMPHLPHNGLGTVCMGLWQTAYGELSHSGTILEFTKR
jgi:hypothetical protein